MGNCFDILTQTQIRHSCGDQMNSWWGLVIWLNHHPFLGKHLIRSILHNHFLGQLILFTNTKEITNEKGNHVGKDQIIELFQALFHIS